MMEKNQSQVSPMQQQIGLLNLRINDMMAQLNTVIKALMDENAGLQAEILRLKGEPAKKAKDVKS